jgi:peptide/nickel transport system substrate-binding protein
LIQYGADGTAQPALASEWRVSDDERTITFDLRRDVTWHDGEPFTARDVAFTYGLLQDEQLAEMTPLTNLWRAVTIEETDTYQIRFTLPAPYAPFLEATTLGILPAHLLTGVDSAALVDHEFNVQPVGTGPFMVAPGNNWRVDGRVVLLPSPAYWDGVRIDAIEMHFYRDEGALMAAFAADEVQAMVGVSAENIATVGRLPGVRLFTSPADRMTELVFNQTDSAQLTALSDRAVRQALAYALDRPAIIDQALGGQGLPLNGPYLTNSQAYQPGIAAFPTRVISATQLLDDSGWLPPEGDELREKDGDFMRLNLLTLTSRRHAAIAQLVKAQWQAVGVNVDVVALDVADYRDALAERAFDVALVDIAPSRDPDLYDLWSQEAVIRGQNYGGWNNQRASEALEAARQHWDNAERAPYYQAFLRYYDNDVPALTLYQWVQTYALSDDVQSAEIPPVTNPRDRFQTLPEWTVLTGDVQVPCAADS